MEIIRLLHSWVRWLVMLVALIDLVYFAIGWQQKRKYDNAAQRLMSAFGGLISLQWLLGVIFLIALASQTGLGLRYYWEHLTVMTIAVFVANLPNILRRRELTDAQRYLVNVVSILAVIGLVIVGISLLPEIIRWRFFLPE